MPKVGNVFLVAGVRRGYMLGAGGGEVASIFYKKSKLDLLEKKIDLQLLQALCF